MDPMTGQNRGYAFLSFLSNESAIKCVQIWDFRLMMDPMTGQNRGYAFLSFLSNESAIKCVQMYDKYEIRNKRELHVTISQPNNRLFVGSIPKTKTKDEIFEEFSK